MIFGYDGKEGLSVLLIKRSEKSDAYPNWWAFPGGFMKMNEDADTSARRELKEETNLDAGLIEQFGCFSDVNRDPRERVAYFALVHKQDVVGGDDAKEAAWFPIGDVPVLAFDHDRILRIALSRLKEKIHFEPIGFELLPEVFTLPQLQALYESILEIKFDRRNFAGKMLKLGILSEAEKRDPKAGTRIPTKYRFNSERYRELKGKRIRMEF